jgi:hypothetical protein
MPSGVATDRGAGARKVGDRRGGEGGEGGGGGRGRGEREEKQGICMKHCTYITRSIEGGGRERESRQARTHKARVR